ncbi:hypothetical protein [Desulfovibrio sp. ZJ200]|uniref:hypothetical protein n=1 Tax=Desulfovibrio sp. ZJ200 TaxID=2709792 RepID=UPI0013E9D338|nr:hypothetical protein [Desulfovibrio sp. ZJ200]
MSDEAAYLPIPGWPGYRVSRRGQVRSEYGVLTCDSKGRVRLRNKATRRQSLFFTGELMGLAGLLADSSGSPAPEPADELLALRRERDALERHVAGLREELENASDTIARGRKLNGHLLALVRKRQTDDASPARKRGRKPAPEAPDVEMPALDFDSEELS